MSYIQEVDYYNSYLIQKVNNRTADDTLDGFGWPGPYLGTTCPLAFPKVNYGGSILIPSATDNSQWYVEEDRIRGGYNNTYTDLGVRAYLDEEYPLQQNRFNTLIYSGIYNSRTGINQTNVFSVADAITKSIDPAYGSIQKTYAEETNLIVFQESRIHRALIDKDTIYTTESGTETQAGRTVIGQFVPYKGEYGISKNPESFAIYNYRKYFADKNHNAIMRLSNDGLTEISMYGMRDYFRDELAELSDEFIAFDIEATYQSGGSVSDTYVDVDPASVTSNQYITPGMTIVLNGVEQPGYITFVEEKTSIRIFYSQLFTDDLSIGTLTIRYYYKGKVLGGWDIHNKNYVVSLQESPSQVTTKKASYNTLAFDEEINGWVSFFTYKPVQLFSLINKFYTIGRSEGQNSSELYQHYADPLSNNRGVFYDTREPSNITFVFNPAPDMMKNFNTISYEGSNGWEVVSYVSGFTGQDPNPDGTPTYVQNKDSILEIKSYDEGLYTDTQGYPQRAGFKRKENRYVANLRNNSTAMTGEVLFGAQMSGIKGYFATVTIETDETTQLGGPKELWAAASNYVMSSY